MKKKNLKPRRLLPTLKEKQHYLVLRGERTKQEIDDSIVEFLGIYGFAKANPRLAVAEKGKTIISINTKYVKEAKVALALKGIACLGVSGTIKKAKQKFWNK